MKENKKSHDKDLFEMLPQAIAALKKNMIQPIFGDSRNSKYLNERPPLRSELFTEEQLKQHARAISKKHLLLVVFFENTSLQALASGEAENIERLYEKVIAEKFVLEKKAIVKELQRYGIHALLTAPEKLTVDVINKYLQIKARREI